MKNILVALFLIALTALSVELSLVRVFDVIWYPNMAYMIITMVMFCFGLAGVFLSLRSNEKGVVRKVLRISDNENPVQLLSNLSVVYGIANLLILPVTNTLPLNFDGIYHEPVQTILLFLILYLVISLPFFIAGLILTILFSHYSKRIQKLYFWDLVGAGIGCLIVTPLTPFIGPAGIIIVAGGMGFLAAALFQPKKSTAYALALIGCIVIAVPCIKSLYAEGYHNQYFDFKHHIGKRGVKGDIEQGRLEATYWDPISKVDIIDQKKWKHIAYDGGNQSSFIFPFDGNYKKLRESLPDSTPQHFGLQAVYLADNIKEGSNPEVLIIGSAAGQETKAALSFGAKHIDTVEMVGFVVKAGKELYNKYNGGIFNDSRVTTHVGEGRSFLRATSKKYDIIQIFSNHTSSSIAAGSGAMATTYLQTTDAYKEYFTHLAKDGLLQINHHIYPRMITTAAKAWKEMGRGNFRKHVLVFGARNVQDNLPTLLIKMSPWSAEEVAKLRKWFWGHTEMLEDPYHPETSMLSDEFYSGELSSKTANMVPYRVIASTDDKPYFNFLRKEWRHYNRAYPEVYMDYGTAALLSSQYLVYGKDGKRHTRLIPTDIIHLFITGFGALFFAVIFILIPLLYSKVGKEKWAYKFHSLGYFACLGSGFIIIELVFIQIFMKLIGFPLYTYSSVVFSLLISAGIGSYVSDLIKIQPNKNWLIPFVGTVITMITALLTYTAVFNYLLEYTLFVRIVTAIILIAPAGFFMGMCFPLGILTIENQPDGAIAWAWGMNGLFTVIGGIGSVLLSIYCGFRVTLFAGILIYVIALYLFMRFRHIAVKTENAG